MASLRFSLLGPPRLERDSVPLQFDTRKIIALVAYLAVDGPSPGGQPHTREALITLLWPELEPSRARAVLRRNLSLLRKALDGEWLVVDRETISLDPDTDLWVDVDQFRQCLAACETHGHSPTETCPDCISLLEETAALYGDHFLAGFTLRDSLAFDEWQFFQTEELKDQLASALVRLARYYTSQGDFEPAITHARHWLALDPLHEPAHRHLMVLYAQSGQRSAALRQYETCRCILDKELGVEPEPGTSTLYEQVLAGGLAGKVAAPSPPPTRKHNLPVQPTPFVGREAVLAEIADRLQDPDCRLLTLVGPGGSGKTRLALKAAADLLPGDGESESRLDSYAHGIFLVSLAPLQSVDSIVPTVAKALGFRFYTDTGGGAETELQQQLSAQQQLLDYLHQKSMLLILDNFEHLLDGADLVTDILKAAPEVRILVTSRARLNVQSEHLFPVTGMDFPDEKATEELTRSLPQNAAQYSAVKLFWTNARRVQPSFELVFRQRERQRAIARVNQVP